MEIHPTVDIRVVLGGGTPMNDDIHEWANENAELASDRGSGNRVTITLCLGDEDLLRELAEKMRAVVRLGARYEVAAYKYVCPRFY